jgi:hypothetical protein
VLVVCKPATKYFFLPPQNYRFGFEALAKQVFAKEAQLLYVKGRGDR